MSCFPCRFPVAAACLPPCPVPLCDTTRVPCPQARRVEKAGAVAALVLDNTSGSSASSSPMFAMSGDGTNDVKIPLAFLFQQDAFRLLQALALDPTLHVTMSDASPEESE